MKRLILPRISFFIPPAKRKAFFTLPLVVLPGLCLFFATLHQRVGKTTTQGVAAMGINTQLPQAVNGRELLNKKLQYEQAERDSLQKAQYERQDPYRRDSGMISRPLTNYTARASTPAVAPLKPVMAADPRAEQVLEQLRQLQRTISVPHSPVSAVVPGGYGAARPRLPEASDTAGDARVGQLNSMLDKVIRIQHPEEARPKSRTEVVSDEVLPADSGANTISAVIASDQTLTAGTTIALRIIDSIKVNGRVWPAGQLIYGTVTINNDRMLVHIGSLREERSLFVIDLQVYDLDGIAGIHIPGVLSRDVAKQSADQGVSSLNVLEADPSLGAQAANAGIQTVKSFVGRKVKQVRVSVRAGYQVLLRESRPKPVRNEQAGIPRPEPGAVIRPPGIEPEGPVIAHCRAEGIRLRLRGIWLCEGRLWFGLEWENRAAIAYAPAYARWYIRDRHQVRRTAMQELPLEPLGGAVPESVASDAAVHSWSGFVPFALSSDKELVLEVAEKGGGRVLELVIKPKELLKANNYVREAREITEPASDRAL
jgi:Conjugative transposon, TraM/Domain of unknown function (DUF4138)